MSGRPAVVTDCCMCSWGRRAFPTDMPGPAPEAGHVIPVGAPIRGQSFLPSAFSNHVLETGIYALVYVRF